MLNVECSPSGICHLLLALRPQSVVCGPWSCVPPLDVGCCPSVLPSALCPPPSVPRLPPSALRPLPDDPKSQPRWGVPMANGSRWRWIPVSGQGLAGESGHGPRGSTLLIADGLRRGFSMDYEPCRKVTPSSPLSDATSASAGRSVN